MKVELIFVWISCIVIARCFDLGAKVRIAQCRSQCLKNFTHDGTCDWYSSHAETVCHECWNNCENLENRWDETKGICKNEHYSLCPACESACSYHKNKMEGTYLASMLPVPRKGAIKLNKYDVAILMRRVEGKWKESGYYPGRRVPNLRSDSWIIVALEDGSIEHYSWQEWTPTLESLKSGALYEATISWKDVENQLKRQKEIEHKRLNNRLRQYFLEKYGEKILQAEWRSEDDIKISEDVFRRFFFRRNDHEELLDVEKSNPSLLKNGHENFTRINSKETYVVCWQPETGGLMGNQVTDSTYAQISLLPGTKYLIRIASNDGPGSFPIEIDTRPQSVQVVALKRHFVDTWEFIIIVVSIFLIFILVWSLCLIRKKRKDKQCLPKEEV